MSTLGQLTEAAWGLSQKVDETSRAIQQLVDAWDHHARVGDWDMVRKFDRWHHERQRKRWKDMSPSYLNNQFYVNTTSTNTNAYTAVNYPSTNTNAYTIVNYPVPTGTTTVSVPQWNYQSPDWQEYERERRPPPREFNRYVNGSDLLEEFIAWLGSQGVRQSEFMDLPVELFIKWLIVRACEEDQQEPNVELVLPRARTPKCLACGRFMVAQPVPLHDDKCASRYFARAA